MFLTFGCTQSNDATKRNSGPDWRDRLSHKRQMQNGFEDGEDTYGILTWSLVVLSRETGWETS